MSTLVILSANGKLLFRNSWSDEGVSTIMTAGGVECIATHLTSFAVLVDVQGSTTTSHGSVIVNVNVCLCY